jgi:hypothetical protein
MTIEIQYDVRLPGRRGRGQFPTKRDRHVSIVPQTYPDVGSAKQSFRPSFVVSAQYSIRMICGPVPGRTRLDTAPRWCPALKEPKWKNMVVQILRRCPCEDNCLYPLKQEIHSPLIRDPIDGKPIELSNRWRSIK